MEEVYVRILSQIGKPINEPKALSVQIIPKSGYDISKLERPARDIAEEMLANVGKITDMVIEGKVRTF